MLSPYVHKVVHPGYHYAACVSLVRNINSVAKKYIVDTHMYIIHVNVMHTNLYKSIPLLACQ